MFSRININTQIYRLLIDLSDFYFMFVSITAVECPDGMKFNPCGQACQPTCAMVVSPNITCEDQAGCTEICECEMPGFVQDGEKCVNTSECGCQLNGKYYSVSNYG